MTDTFYYKIALSYEVQTNIIDSEEPNIVKAKEMLYENIKNSMPDKYDKFYMRLTTYQMRDSLNYVIHLDSFFSSTGSLPMTEYVDARDIKDEIKQEMEEFFSSIDCEYKQLNIITLI